MSFKGLSKTLSYLFFKNFFLNSNFCLIFNLKYIIIINIKRKGIEGVSMRNLNEDQRTVLIQEINDRLQDLSDSMLREILNSLKTQEEKKFNGNIIAASSITGSALHAGDFFDNIRELEAKLPRIDPNNRKKVEKLLSDYYWRDGKVKFIRSGEKCDIYHCFEKQSGYPLVVYLYKE